MFSSFQYRCAVVTFAVQRRPLKAFHVLIPVMGAHRLQTVCAFAIVAILMSSLALAAQDAPRAAATSPSYTGMYSFLRDGEFVQLNVENDGRLTGFISRYGDSDSDRGVFLDQFFKQAKIDGNKVSFTTAVIHDVFFDFAGTIERGEGKSPGDEAFYVMKGTITEHMTDGAQKATAKSHEVAFKSFPHELSSPQ